MRSQQNRLDLQAGKRDTGGLDPMRLDKCGVHASRKTLVNLTVNRGLPLSIQKCGVRTDRGGELGRIRS